jgi:hypothetical protein
MRRIAGLLMRATLLRPGHAEVRDPTGFPGWQAHGTLEELRVVALPGVVPPMALVRWPQWPGDEAVIVDLELAGGGRRAELATIGAVVKLAGRAGARRVRTGKALG